MHEEVSIGGWDPRGMLKHRFLRKKGGRKLLGLVPNGAFCGLMTIDGNKRTKIEAV